MTSSEGFQEHFSIISKFVCCDFYLKKECSFYNHLFCCTEIRWMFISWTTIWVTSLDTGSVASRARRQLTSSKCEWTRIWSRYLECRWNHPISYFDPKKYSLKPKLTFSPLLLTDPASMQTVRQKKTASSSEPKLFKTNVFSRQKAMRHTFRFSKQDSGTAKSRFKKLRFKKETWFKKHF